MAKKQLTFQIVMYNSINIISKEKYMANNYIKDTLKDVLRHTHSHGT